MTNPSLPPARRNSSGAGLAFDVVYRFSQIELQTGEILINPPPHPSPKRPTTTFSPNEFLSRMQIRSSNQFGPNICAFDVAGLPLFRCERRYCL